MRDALAVLLAVCAAATASIAAADEIALPPAGDDHPIVFSADAANRWTQGSYEVWLLTGGVTVEQGETKATSRDAVLWVKRAGNLPSMKNMVIAYFEGDVRVENKNTGHGYSMTDEYWIGEFTSTGPVLTEVVSPAGEPTVKSEVYRNAIARRDPFNNAAHVRPAQYTQFDTIPPATLGAPAGTRRFLFNPRGAARVQGQSFSNPAANEQVLVIDSGVNLIIDGVRDYGVIDIVTDRMVVWTTGSRPPSLGESVQDESVPYELYMEGNIVFRQGNREIRAQRMYYDVNNRVGMILDAEIYTPVPDYNGLLRLKADVIQQTGQDRFLARNTYLTSSRIGKPRYRFSSGEIYFEDNQMPVFDPFTGLPEVDASGEQIVVHERLATSRNNVVYLGDVPVFYWPVLASDLEDPTYYIRRAQVRNDRIFGTQILTEWDMYQLLGIRNEPEGTDWTASGDYLSERGFGYGTRFLYDRTDLFGVPGPYAGILDAWAIKDHGLDTLGSDRVDIPPEQTYRYRILGRHRQQLPNNFQFTSELGLISDRNFVEQYYENEWDEFKDMTTGFELKQQLDNRSWSLTGDTRVNDFFTQTEWFPRLDHFWLGEPLLGDTLTWYEHSDASYAKLRVTSAPTDPAQAAKTKLLPWEATASGERLVTRQEMDLPLQAGPFKFVPYALGEAAHWGQVLAAPNITGDETQRLYGQLGMRGSIPFWSVDPTIESWLFNVHGVAHKVTLEADFSYADANRDLAEFPLYEPVDDDNIEAFRRRFTFNTFGGAIPLQFDERFYALRSGLGSWVTSPSTEIADDLATLRMGLLQRWQTKRGPAGNRRTIDWIVFDTDAVYYPDADRDNFGEDFGLAMYDFRWHIGDRLTMLSGGGFDFFDQGQQIASVGLVLTRPPRGSLYTAFTSLGGPIDSQVATTTFSYRMSPKWIASAGASYDFKNANIGEALNLTRVGESFLVNFGFDVDHSKNNVQVSLMVEPRFLPSMRLGRVGGAAIPMAGIYGLE